MNYRIKELAKQAGLNIDGYGYPIWGCLDGEDEKKEFLEKLAELIVQECAKQCTEISLKEDGIATLPPGQQSFASYRAGAIACSNRIKYYFGVK
jgi:hypothetical protein